MVENVLRYLDCFKENYVMNKLLRKLNIYEVVLFVWTFVASYYVTYKMTVADGTVYYVSDYPAHIQSALSGTGYSLMEVIMKYLFMLTSDTKLIVFFISSLIALTGFAIRNLLELCLSKDTYRDVKSEIIITIAYSFIFLSSIYLPNRSPFYILRDGYNVPISLENTHVISFMTQPWHNSTYMAMRLFGIMAIIYWIKIWNSDSNIKNYVGLFLSLTFANLFKPNFIIAFAPTVFVYAILDLLINKKLNAIKKYLALAVLFIVSMLPLLFQYKVLYSSDDSSGISFTLKKVSELFKAGYLGWELLGTFTFPLIVAVIVLVNRKQDWILGLAWIFELITLIQSLFMVETGTRLIHGNFTWNLYLASLALYTVCTAKLIDICDDSLKLKWVYKIAWGILFIHIVNSFMYFGLIFIGVGYDY